MCIIVGGSLILSFFLTCYNLNTLRPRQHGRHFADDTFKRIFLNENVRISIKNSLKFVPKGPINNIPALVQIMAWRRPGDKPLSEAMMVSLLTHICVTRPQWVNRCVILLHLATVRCPVLPWWQLTLICEDVNTLCKNKIIWGLSYGYTSFYAIAMNVFWTHRN